MTIETKLLINFYIQDGCDPKEEVEVKIQTVNHCINIEDFELIQMAVDDYIEESNLRINVHYEALFLKVAEFDSDTYSTNYRYEFVKQQSEET